MTIESKEYPIFSALVNEARGVCDDAMAAFIPEENDETRAAWDNVTAMIEKYVSGLEAQSELTDAIIAHELAAAWLAYKNGIRVALELQKELRKIAAPEAAPVIPSGDAGQHPGRAPGA